jgi:uncharacterized protein YecE (DUF72 family)
LSGPIHIGTCAWSFDDWRSFFYPESLPPSEWLGWYARHLASVEIDSTFYAVPTPRVIGRWLDLTPETFRFTCKMPREITHELRLRDASEKAREFLDALAPLRRRLGPVLIQLPANFRPEQDEAALKAFLMELPRDFAFAVEFRHADWHLPRMVRFFEQEGLCWVWTDTTPPEQQSLGPFEFLPQTADCLYVRLLGDLKTKYREDGSRPHQYRDLKWPRDSSLESWAIKVRKHLEQASCVYLFANNHFEGFAPLTCQRIGRHFGMEITLPHRPEDAPAPTAADPFGDQLKLL